MASVVVIGAGLAGLCCAWRLQRAGFDVEVLERSERSGGRLDGERVDGFLLEGAGAFFSSNDRSLHAVANHLDLATHIQSLPRRPDALHRAGEFSALRPSSDLLLVRSPAISRMASLRLLRLRLEWMRWRKELDPAFPQAPRAPEAIAGLEAEGLTSYLDRIVGAELRECVIEPYVSAALGLDAKELSAAYFLLLIDRVAGAQPQYLAGGLKQLAARLAQRLSVRYGCEVTSIETQADGARVRYRAGERQGSAVANAAVVAIPGPQVLDVCPKVTPSERGFFEGVRFSRGVVAHLLFDADMPFPYRCVSFPRRKGFGLRGVQAAHHKRDAAPPGAGLLRASLSEASSKQMWTASDAEVAAMVLENLESTPFGRLLPRRVVVDRSALSSPVFYPGYLGSLKRFAERSERSERLAFCGDYLIGNGVEAALVSGMRAASQVAHGLV